MTSNHSRVQSARATLVYGLLFLLIFVAGLSLALETSKPHWRDPEFGHRIDRLNEIKKEHPSITFVLALGTSRTQNAIHPSSMGFLDEAGSMQMFNFGQSGSSPLKVLLTFRRILDEGIRPSAIIVEVLPVWLTLGGAAEVQFREMIPQLSHADLRYLAPYCDCPEELYERWLSARAAPWHAQRISLVSHWLPKWMPWQSRINFQWQSMDRDGFVPFLYSDPPPEFRSQAIARTHEQYEGSFRGFWPSAMSLRALKDLVDLCRSQDIPIAFIVPPVAPTFRNWFAPVAWSAGETHLLALSQELGVGLFSSPQEFTDNDFADGHHMLRKSAQSYSRWLADTHLRAWCSRKR
ncbi:MAG TPA: hypothetical protein VG097_00300 [Gemmata sp.]|nr:hypothetical protein [Gemmata sp.]